MAITKRILALLLSAAMFLTSCAALAEGETVSAGEVTRTAIAYAYADGMQIDVNVAFDAASEGELSARMQAFASLLQKMNLSMSFYDDFGTARVRGDLTMDGVTLLSLDAQVFEDGSAQMVTNLTGSAVLTVPAGSVTKNGLKLTSSTDDLTLRLLDRASKEFRALPARERLRITWGDIQLVLINHLLGWTSYVQRETGELYTFDVTPIEATETRDAVAQRMIGKINSWDFCELFFNTITTIRDEQGAFQQALADTLAETGVTRYQVRQFIDKLLPDVEMDPAVDWVQPSSAIADDGALCQFDDISYVIRKLHKSIDAVLGNSGDNDLHMAVSYNEEGGMVGFDLEMPIISDITPYEGSFTYSLKTAEDTQRDYIAHGELQLYDGYRLVGDLTAHGGEDIDGVKESTLNGYLNLNQDGACQIGGDVDMGLSFRTDGGSDAEAFQGHAQLALRAQPLSALIGSEKMALAASVNGATAVDEGGFTLAADAAVSMMGRGVTAAITAQSVDFDEKPFPEGTTVDITDESALESLQTLIMMQVMSIYGGLTANAEIMQNVMALIGQ